MPSTYSSNLKIELMATGENANTWGTITNTNLGTALEQAIVGYGNPDFASDANLTITLSNSNSAQAARALVLNVTSSVSLTATRELVVPTIQKQYIVQNNTTGAQSVTVKTSAGTGVTVPNGRKAHLYVDGTNVVQMFDFVDINGGTIDGVSIGASSASTGAFTTVSTGNGTAGTPALNATADTNTGLYFPAADTLGLVTGGTERARVDSSGNLGIGTTGPGAKLEVAGTSTGATLEVLRVSNNGSGGNTQAQINFTSTATSYASIAGGYGASAPQMTFNLPSITAGNYVWQISSSERMRLDSSGNLGIGTSSPSARLHVGTSGGTIQLRLGNNTGSDYWGIGRDNVTTGDLVFQLQTSERMRLTASSNLGVAVVPNAWSGLNAVQVGYGTLANNNAGDYTLLSSNNYYDGTNWRYISSSTATMYRQLVGAHAWFSASSGTAGNVVSWTQAMTLDASGNLGLGSTAPVGYTGYSGVTVQNTNGGFINLRNGANTNQMEIAVDTGNTGYVKTVTAIPLTFGTNNTERMRLDASGNLGIGTSSPSYSVDIRNAASTALRVGSNSNSFGTLLSWDNPSGEARLWSLGAYALVLGTNGTERMRLDSSGNLGIGTSSPNIGLDVASGYLWVGPKTAVSGAGGNVRYRDDTGTYRYAAGILGAAAETSFAIYDEVAASVRLILNSSGNLGLGVAPSAWGSNFKAIESAAASSFAIAGANINGISILSNAYADNSNWRYTTTGPASRYAINQNIHQWFNAPSGTAGNAISFTQAMALDASGNLLVGTASQIFPTSNRVTIEANGTSQALFGLAVGGTSAGYLMHDGTNVLLYQTRAGAMLFGTNNVERMRLDSSGNLGIGTSSPAFKLDVRGDAAVWLQSSGSIAAIRGFTGSSGNLVLQSDAGSGIAWWLSAKNSGILAIGGNGGSEPTGALNINSSGNVGIGSTSPSARLHVAIDGAGQATPAALFFSNNDGFSPQSLAGLAIYSNRTSGFIDTTLVYGNTVNSYLAFGNHNGTSYSERMRLDASGNLMVGGTGETYRISSIKNTGTSGLETNFIATNQTDSNFAISVSGSAASDKRARIGTVSNTALTFATADAERMRLDTSGNLGIGGTPSGWSPGTFRTAIQIGYAGFAGAPGTEVTEVSSNQYVNSSGNRIYIATAVATLYQQNAGQHAFYTAPSGTAGNAVSFTQAMTLTASGNLLVGTTSDAANVRTNITFNGATRNGLRLVNTDTSGSPYAFALSYPNYSPNNTNQIINFSDSSLTRFEFRANGGLANYQANDVNLSDRREKTNFAPAKSYLDTICAIPVQTFNYIDQPDDDPGLTLGVVAQDVQAVAPELVMESNWGTEDNPKMRLSIYQTDLQYALMKCIQEQQAIINDLRARVAALESN